MPYVDLEAHKQTLILAVLARKPLIYEILFNRVCEEVRGHPSLTHSIWRLVEHGYVKVDPKSDLMSLTFEGWVRHLARAESGETRVAIRTLRERGKTLKHGAF